MILGEVNAAYEAVVPLSVQGSTGPVRTIQAVVDTGYSGFLTLPPSMVAEMGLPFVYAGRAILANDDEARFGVHDVSVLWDGQTRPIRADATGSVPLLGMLLLDGHDLTIEVGIGGRVAIQARE